MNKKPNTIKLMDIQKICSDLGIDLQTYIATDERKRA